MLGLHGSWDKMMILYLESFKFKIDFSSQSPCTTASYHLDYSKRRKEYSNKNWRKVNSKVHLNIPVFMFNLFLSPTNIYLSPKELIVIPAITLFSFSSLMRKWVITLNRQAAMKITSLCKPGQERLELNCILMRTPYGYGFTIC